MERERETDREKNIDNYVGRIEYYCEIECIDRKGETGEREETEKEGE